MYHIETRACISCFDAVVWCMDRPCRYTHGGPPCAPSRSRTARARGPAHSRARGARDLDLDARTRRSFSVSLSLAFARAGFTRFVPFHVISFVPGGGGRSPNGCARISLARGDDEDEDADDAFVRVSSLVWIVVSRRDARALENIETEEDDDAGWRRRGRFSIRPERVTDVRG